MVSQPEHSTSLTLRGPSSVVSRPSYSRTKRYNRSHAGGGSYIPQNEFPVFSQSGDVEILVKAGGHENRYLLHRHTLTRCSGFFEVSTSQEWSKAVTTAPPPPLPAPSSTELARLGNGNTHHGTAADAAIDSAPRRRWRYELDPGTGDLDIPMLVQKEGSSSGGSVDGAAAPAAGASGAVSLFGGSSGPANTAVTRSKTLPQSTHGNHGFFRSVANLHAPPPLKEEDVALLRDYDNLFRIFYNYPPILDGVNIADAYVQCKSLLTLADQYDALAVVGPRVDHHLLQFQSRLWKQIAKYPISYLRLGYLARSKVMFQEALIHVVGQWPVGERSLRQALPDSVLDIILDKVDELEESVGRVEGRLFRLSLSTARGERVSPATSYLDWLAVSLFRQWLADNTSPPPSSSSLPPALPPPSSSSSSTDRHVSTSSHRDGGGRHHNHSHSHHQMPPPPSPATATVGRTYRILGGAGGASYLGHDECKKFLKLTPELYSRENLRRFEKRLDELKGLARGLVLPLMGSGLELDLGGTRVNDGIGYLTCTTVGDRDLPWFSDY